MKGEIHVYGQQYPHDSVYIVGSREALQSLVQQIQEALSGHRVSAREYSTGDGEGFELGVLVGPDRLGDWVLPYTDSAFAGGAADQFRAPWKDQDMRSCMLQLRSK